MFEDKLEAVKLKAEAEMASIRYIGELIVSEESRLREAFIKPSEEEEDVHPLLFSRIISGLDSLIYDECHEAKHLYSLTQGAREIDHPLAKVGWAEPAGVLSGSNKYPSVKLKLTDAGRKVANGWLAATGLDLLEN